MELAAGRKFVRLYRSLTVAYFGYPRNPRCNRRAAEDIPARIRGTARKRVESGNARLFARSNAELRERAFRQPTSWTCRHMAPQQRSGNLPWRLLT